MKSLNVGLTATLWGLVCYEFISLTADSHMEYMSLCILYRGKEVHLPLIYGAKKFSYKGDINIQNI
jgi:hypothetical protein